MPMYRLSLKNGTPSKAIPDALVAADPRSAAVQFSTLLEPFEGWDIMRRHDLAGGNMFFVVAVDESGEAHTFEIFRADILISLNKKKE